MKKTKKPSAKKQIEEAIEKVGEACASVTEAGQHVRLAEADIMDLWQTGKFRGIPAKDTNILRLMWASVRAAEDARKMVSQVLNTVHSELRKMKPGRGKL